MIRKTNVFDTPGGQLIRRLSEGKTTFICHKVSNNQSALSTYSLCLVTQAVQSQRHRLSAKHFKPTTNLRNN